MSLRPGIRIDLIMISALFLTAPCGVSGADTDDGTPAPDKWEAARDPFWPVGYTPPPSAEVESDTVRQTAFQAQLQWPMLRLIGLTLTGQGLHLALIEGVGIVEAGETIQVEREGIVYRWRVDAVTARGINVRQLEARPARRGDLHNVGQ